MSPQKITHKTIFLLGLMTLIHLYISGQQAFHNFGSIQMHNDAQIGFHLDVINDGKFDENTGLTGFYNETSDLTISGNDKPIFHNVEIDIRNNNDLLLEVPVGVNQFQEFINGRVITPRNQPLVSLDYINDTPYLGENDDRHVDGYATSIGQLDFWFPTGDDFRLRPIKIENGAAINLARAAYFFEDPNEPNFFNEQFNTLSFENFLFGISIFEFWDLDGNVPTEVTLTWDNNSNIPTLVDDLEDLRVVGWHKEQKRWINLGNISYSGNLSDGEITSNTFLPDTFEILTFGSSSSLLDGDLEVFTAVSPNGDNFNDNFFIQGLERFPENKVSIYNRWGVLVYEKEAYHLLQKEGNGFKGISEGRVTIAQNEELPAGTYYYVLKVIGEKDKAGFLYLNR